MFGTTVADKQYVASRGSANMTLVGEWLKYLCNARTSHGGDVFDLLQIVGNEFQGQMVCLGIVQIKSLWQFAFLKNEQWPSVSVLLLQELRYLQHKGQLGYSEI